MSAARRLGIASVDFAAVEHAAHELADAQGRLRRAKASALVAAGWTEYVYTSPYWDETRDGRRRSGGPRVMYAPPGAKREREKVEPAYWPYGVQAPWNADAVERSRKKKFYRYRPHHQLGAAFAILEREAKRRCGPTSCERPPRGGRRTSGKT